MAKIISIHIQESITELKSLHSKQKTILKRSRVKALLLIKQGKVLYTSELARKLKYDRKTIYNWLQTYQSNGLKALIEVKSGGNNTVLLSDTTKQAIFNKLQEGDHGFYQYTELLEWAKNNLQKNITYGSLYKFCTVHIPKEYLPSAMKKKL